MWYIYLICFRYNKYMIYFIDGVSELNYFIGKMILVFMGFSIFNICSTKFHRLNYSIPKVVKKCKTIKYDFSHYINFRFIFSCNVQSDPLYGKPNYIWVQHK